MKFSLSYSDSPRIYFELLGNIVHACAMVTLLLEGHSSQCNNLGFPERSVSLFEVRMRKKRPSAKVWDPPGVAVLLKA
jgi:hypothetical protein